jgi:hypothetical protein
MIDAFLQRALEMRESLAAASEAHVFADVVSALLAPLALLARQTDLHGHPITRREISDLRPDRGHHAGGFMSEAEGLPDEDVAVSEM